MKGIDNDYAEAMKTGIDTFDAWYDVENIWVYVDTITSTTANRVMYRKTSSLSRIKSKNFGLIRFNCWINYYLLLGFFHDYVDDINVIKL